VQDNRVHHIGSFYEILNKQIVLISDKYIVIIKNNKLQIEENFRKIKKG